MRVTVISRVIILISRQEQAALLNPELYVDVGTLSRKFDIS